VVVDLDAASHADEHRELLREALDPERPTAPDFGALQGEMQQDGVDLGPGGFGEGADEAVAKLLASRARRDPEGARRTFDLVMRSAIPDGPALAALREAEAVVMLDAVPFQAVRLAIERAWHPVVPPRIVALREQSPWSSPEQIAHAVAAQAAQALGAPHAAVAQHLRDLPARYHVVLLQRPPPPPELLLAAKRMLGGAVFVCLAGPGAKAPGHTVLPLGLPEGGLPFVMQHYKPLAQIVAPRPPTRGPGPRPPRREQAKKR
jgi:hypothetical protein